MVQFSHIKMPEKMKCQVLIYKNHVVQASSMSEYLKGITLSLTTKLILVNLL
jgi:hypothetical protein